MTRSGPAGPTVLDTTVLSNFASVDWIGGLTMLPRVATVPSVNDELRAGVETHPYLSVALDVLDEEIPVLSPTDEERALETTLVKRIDPGEAQVLAVADSRNGTVVTDDGDARSIARDREVTLTGSIGVLIRGVERGEFEFDEADQALKRWIDEEGFRAPSRDLDEYR